MLEELADNSYNQTDNRTWETSSLPASSRSLLKS